MTCTNCQTTADVWRCSVGEFCRLHLPLDAGAIWRTMTQLSRQRQKTA